MSQFLIVGVYGPAINMDHVTQVEFFYGKYGLMTALLYLGTSTHQFSGEDAMRIAQWLEAKQSTGDHMGPGTVFIHRGVRD